MQYVIDIGSNCNCQVSQGSIAYSALEKRRAIESNIVS